MSYQVSFSRAIQAPHPRQYPHLDGLHQNNKGDGVFYMACLLEILTESSVAISQSSSTSSQAWWDKPCDLALSEPGQ